MTVAGVVTLVVRYGLVMLFLPFSALDKVLNFQGAVTQAQEVFKPRTLATIILMCGLGIEIFASLGVVTGIADRFCALLIAGYCAATAVLYKRFWAPGDFWASGDSKARNMFWDFLKNLSLGAGFLLLVIGTTGAGLQPFLAHPFESSHPYAAGGHRP
ncbi:MAG TPA: DoxX family membrane protein [Pseudolabrys sp.]|jgi:putative oxidoreductase|nr:DoxX family membrane protein [Pseudolabrys sp.]